MKKETLTILMLAYFSSCNTEKYSSQYSDATCLTTVENLSQAHPFELLDKPYYTYFQDQTLEFLQTRLFENNPTLKELGSKIQALYDEASGSKSQLFPQLSFIFQDNYQYYSRNSVFAVLAPNIPAALNDFTTGLGFQWNLDLFSKQRYLYKALKAESIAEIYKQKTKALELSGWLSKAYLNTQILKQIEQVVESQIEICENRLELEQALKDSNLSNEFSTLNLREELLNVKRELELLKHAEVLDRTLVQELIGLMPDNTLLSNASPLPNSLPLIRLEDLNLELITRRPDIQMAVHLLKASEFKIKSAKAAFYPNLNLNALAGFDSVMISKLIGSSSQSYNLNPVLELPLFNAGLLSSKLHKERHLYESLIHSYDKALLKAARDVTSQTSSFLEHEKAFLLSSKTQDLASEKLNLRNQTFVAGLSTQMHLYNERLARLSQIKKTLEDKRDYLYSFVDLALSLGGGL